jgi:hypothetical protein
LILAQPPAGLAPARALELGPRGCGDFLAEIGKKPVHLTYIGCAYAPDRQGKPLRAIYHVGGDSARATEAELVQVFGLTPLKRYCCLWESPARQFRNAKGREFSITMASEETTAATRAEWPKIGMFEVVVETFTEEI